MRPTVSFTLHAALATALIALAASGAAASGFMYLKLQGAPGENSAGSHGGQLEIESFSWGSARASGSKDVVLKGSKVGENAPADGGWIADVERPAAGRGTAIGTAIGGYANDGNEGSSAGISIGPGNLKEMSLDKSNARTSAGGPQTMTVGANRTESAGLPGKRTPPTVTLKRGMSNSGEKGGTEDINIGVGELQAAGGAGARSGQATGKRQHMPMRMRMSYDQPLARGSVWVRVSTPWAGCRVGARYPSLELGEGTRRYVLQDVTVAACGGDADDRPTEEVAFYYNRIAFNYATTRDGAAP